MDRDELIESIANRIDAELGPPMFRPERQAETEAGRQKLCRRLARAAILAVLDGIREPSEDVLEIGGEAYSDTVDLDVKPITYARAVWSAMIDAKKKEIEG